MSLDVSPDLLASAELGAVDEASFVDCIRTSLPYAWDMISVLVAEHASGDSDRPFVDNQVPPPDEQARGQLLRALASDAIRGSLERHFGVTLAFQNCHRVAVFAAGAVGTEAYERFVSPRAQLLNQSPVLRDC
ncbi:MAG TPA: SCO5389 family protein [Acidimicrobiia bacterium]|nr:SCO5389 family protein [Acidimicrobiia bacterium]